ncbi:MAG: DUF6263 family protein [Mucilaginibacter sp.]
MDALINRVTKKTQLLLTVFFVFCSCISNAQTVQRIFTFEKGDNYQKRTFLNSTFIIQRGAKALTVTSSSSVYKTYKVTDVSDKAYTFKVSIPKMDVVITAAGASMHFDSEKDIDTTSKIETALKYMVGKHSDVLVDRTGIILSDDDFSDKLANDTLLSFAGIQPESFIKGSQFNVIPNFVVKRGIKKGYKWKDTATFSRQKMTTRFWIDQVTPTNTIIKFKSFVTGDLVNSNSTGTYIVDNKSGILVQRLIQSISTGYQILNGVVYSTTRRISLSEDCAKKDEKTSLPPDDSFMVVTK